MKLLDRPHAGEAQGQRPSLLSQSPLLPWLVVLFVGSAALGLYFLITPALGHGRYYKVGYKTTPYVFTKQILLLFIPYALALWAWRRGKRVSVAVLFGGALLLHLIFLFAPPPQSQDFYQYLFYGRIQAAHGGNPYINFPGQYWADPWFPWTRWHGWASVYGPAWMLVTWGVAKAAGRSLTLAVIELKLVILALDVAVMWLLVTAGRMKGTGASNGDGDGDNRNAGWPLLLFAWNPMVLITVPLAGSADIVLAGAFIGAYLARRRGRATLTTVLLTLAALVKIYALVPLALHLLLLLRERGWRRVASHAGVAPAIAAAFYAPYWSGLHTFDALIKAMGLSNLSLVGMAQKLLSIGFRHFGVTDRPGHLAQMILRVPVAAALVAAGVWAVRKVRDERSLWWATLVVLSVYLYLSPWYLYWYLLAPLALVAVMPRNRLTYPILTFSATSLIAVWFKPYAVGQSLQTLLRYVPPLVVFTGVRRRVPVRQHGSAPMAIPASSTGTVTARAPAPVVK
jgi:hypothetical protein